MKIGFLTSVFFNNIGNAFIDYGCEAQLKACGVQDMEIIKLSQCANFAATMGNAFFIKEMPGVNWLWTRFMQKYANKWHDKSYNSVNTLDVFSPAKIAKMDYLIIPGCILTTPFFVIFGKLLQEKVKQGCKLIFWAASGNHYTENEVAVVSKWLAELKPYAICTRDSKAFEFYSKFAPHVYNGIDNVFFINRLDIPKAETTLTPYNVYNFDEPKHLSIKKELEERESLNIIYTDHKPYPYSKVSRLSKKNIMCSDFPLDYLFIYKNVNTTYSDRVHACIPTLCFGNKAQLFSDSPRIALFENVGIDINQLKQSPMSIDLEHLIELQDKQIAFLKNILK